MKKTSSILIAAAISLFVGLTAMAQTTPGTHTPHINKRQHEQQKRIRQGVRSGELPGHRRHEARGHLEVQPEVPGPIGPLLQDGRADLSPGGRPSAQPPAPGVVFGAIAFVVSAGTGFGAVDFVVSAGAGFGATRVVSGGAAFGDTRVVSCGNAGGATNAESRAPGTAPPGMGMGPPSPNKVVESVGAGATCMARGMPCAPNRSESLIPGTACEPSGIEPCGIGVRRASESACAHGRINF